MTLSNDQVLMLLVIVAVIGLCAYSLGRDDARRPVATVRLYWDGAVIEGVGPLEIERMACPAPRPKAADSLGATATVSVTHNVSTTSVTS